MHAVPAMAQKRHVGDLTAASPGAGQGSTFTMTIPLRDDA